MGLGFFEGKCSSLAQKKIRPTSRAKRRRLSRVRGGESTVYVEALERRDGYWEEKKGRHGRITVSEEKSNGGR